MARSFSCQEDQDTVLQLLKYKGIGSHHSYPGSSNCQWGSRSRIKRLIFVWSANCSYCHMDNQEFPTLGPSPPRHADWQTAIQLFHQHPCSKDALKPIGDLVWEQCLETCRIALETLHCSKLPNSSYALAMQPSQNSWTHECCSKTTCRAKSGIISN